MSTQLLPTSGFERKPIQMVKMLFKFQGFERKCIPLAAVMPQKKGPVSRSQLGLKIVVCI